MTGIGQDGELRPFESTIHRRLRIDIASHGIISKHSWIILSQLPDIIHD